MGEIMAGPKFSSQLKRMLPSFRRRWGFIPAGTRTGNRRVVVARLLELHLDYPIGHVSMKLLRKNGNRVLITNLGTLN